MTRLLPRPRWCACAAVAARGLIIAVEAVVAVVAVVAIGTVHRESVLQLLLLLLLHRNLEPLVGGPGWVVKHKVWLSCPR